MVSFLLSSCLLISCILILSENISALSLRPVEILSSPSPPNPYNSKHDSKYSSPYNSMSYTAPTPCPSPIPNPSNPIGCLLYTINISVQVPYANSIGYDSVAKPNTLIIAYVGDGVGANPVGIYYTNGTFFKFLTTNSTQYPLNGPQTSIVDKTGNLYIALTYFNAVYIFSPYPVYSFISAISNIFSPITLGWTIVPSGEYLGISANNIILLYRIIKQGNNITGTEVANSPRYNGYTYGGIFDPITGELVYIESSNITTLHFYTPIYNDSKSPVTLLPNHTFTTSNSGMQNESFAVSFQIDTKGRIFILSRNANKTADIWGTLGLVLLNNNGSNAIQQKIIPTGISEDMVFVFMSIAPDGSVIYVPSPQNGTVLAFQGFFPSDSKEE